MKKYKIGYTTGTFDLFHVGHLNIIREAKKQCDKLIVGVHSDEWVYHLKKKFPVINFEDRKTILEAIKYVDLVIKNETLDKISVWKEYGFDVVFSGDDYKGSELWKGFEEEYRKVGVDVVYIPYTKSISSSKIKEKLGHEGNKDS